MNITLIGMAACGKSTVGLLLAKKLNMNFVDIDAVIQNKYNKLLWQIIEEEGTAAFLQKESQTILENRYKNTCISTGGSAVYSKSAMEYLKSISIIIFLDSDYKTIKKRIADTKIRGVIIENKKTLYQVYTERQKLYKQYADLTIATKGLKTMEVVEEIIKNKNLY